MNVTNAIDQDTHDAGMFWAVGRKRLFGRYESGRGVHGAVRHFRGMDLRKRGETNAASKRHGWAPHYFGDALRFMPRKPTPGEARRLRWCPEHGNDCRGEFRDCPQRQPRDLSATEIAGLENESLRPCASCGAPSSWRDCGHHACDDHARRDAHDDTCASCEHCAGGVFS